MPWRTTEITQLTMRNTNASHCWYRGVSALLLYVLDGPTLSRSWCSSLRARRGFCAQYNIAYRLHPQARSQPDAGSTEKACCKENIDRIDADQDGFGDRVRGEDEHVEEDVEQDE